jgi:guanylate kinase
MKPVIIAIAGLSGAGKTYASEFLKKRCGIPSIVSYTTRPMREGETDGVEHFFVSDKEIPPKKEMMACTKFGEYFYWTTASQLPTKGKCTYVIDEKGLIGMRARFCDMADIRPVYIRRDISTLIESVGKERLKRDEDRYSLAETFYCKVIDNNGTLKEFEDKLTTMINNI